MISGPVDSSMVAKLIITSLPVGVATVGNTVIVDTHCGPLKGASHALLIGFPQSSNNGSACYEDPDGSCWLELTKQGIFLLSEAPRGAGPEPDLPVSQPTVLQGPFAALVEACMVEEPPGGAWVLDAAWIGLQVLSGQS